MIYLVADAGRRGYQNILDAFWDECASLEIPLPTERPLSAAAFCKARKKLKPAVIRDLLHDVGNAFAKRHGQSHGWKGRRVLACDGAKLSVQRSSESWKAFGGPTGGHCPQVLISALFDVFAKVPVDITVAPFASCERTELERMLDHVCAGDVLLLDRGYPSFALLRELIDRQIDFVVRCPVKHTFKAVESFITNGQRDADIKIDPTARATGRRESISVRAVYHDRDNDDGCVTFLTSLPRSEATAEEIQELYGHRWAVEEYFKVEQGSYLGQKQLHAKSPEGVEQEILAFALFICIARTIMNNAAEEHEIDSTEIAQKAGFLAVATYITYLVTTETGVTEESMRRLLRRIAARRERPRPGRCFPRRSYLPSARWGATGRRGSQKSSA